MSCFFDENQVRYTLASTLGGKAINWLFFPGGPGCDSAYFLPLIKALNLPGNVWLIDFPGCGSNTVKDINYDDYLTLFPKIISRFSNVVVVGHSFGGMLPLLFPELETLLLGLVIMNSSPSVWMQEAANVAKAYNLPDLTEDMQAFTNDPSQATFDKAIQACAPYYFTTSSYESGRKWLSEIPFSWGPAVWWQRKVIEIEYAAKWAPQLLKTFIIGGEFDAMTPMSLFETDERFKRDNIHMVTIKAAGHMPWFEQLDKVVTEFSNFVNFISTTESID